MHELSVAQNIIEIVTDTAEQQKAKHVSEVVLDIGAVSGIVPDNLEFAWEVSIKNTLLEGAVLKINFIEAKALCLNCHSEFKIDDLYSVCEHCGSVQFEYHTRKRTESKIHYN